MRHPVLTHWDIATHRGRTGAYTQWGNDARCTMAKIGEGEFLMIMMLLFVSIIIYYYMNTFITLHQCTF